MVSKILVPDGEFPLSISTVLRRLFTVACRQLDLHGRGEPSVIQSWRVSAKRYTRLKLPAGVIIIERSRTDSRKVALRFFSEEKEENALLRTVLKDLLLPTETAGQIAINGK
jgi:hypothetical protein